MNSAATLIRFDSPDLQTVASASKFMAENENAQTTSLPPQTLEAGKVQPKKETVRISLPPRPGAAKETQKISLPPRPGTKPPSQPMNLPPKPGSKETVRLTLPTTKPPSQPVSVKPGAIPGAPPPAPPPPPSAIAPPPKPAAAVVAGQTQKIKVGVLAPVSAQPGQTQKISVPAQNLGKDAKNLNLLVPSPGTDATVKVPGASHGAPAGAAPARAAAPPKPSLPTTPKQPGTGAPTSAAKPAAHGAPAAAAHGAPVAAAKEAAAPAAKETASPAKAAAVVAAKKVEAAPKEVSTGKAKAGVLDLVLAVFAMGVIVTLAVQLIMLNSSISR